MEERDLEPDEFREAVEEAVDAVLAKAPTREALVAAVADLLERAVRTERHRCADVSRERAALWRKTPAATADVAAAREEARARANEAAYIADLLENPRGDGAQDADEEVN
jgi:hypothetical protein